MVRPFFRVILLLDFLSSGKRETNCKKLSYWTPYFWGWLMFCLFVTFGGRQRHVSPPLPSPGEPQHVWCSPSACTVLLHHLRALKLGFEPSCLITTMRDLASMTPWHKFSEFICPIRLMSVALARTLPWQHRPCALLDAVGRSGAQVEGGYWQDWVMGRVNNAACKMHNFY